MGKTEKVSDTGKKLNKLAWSVFFGGTMFLALGFGNLSDTGSQTLFIVGALFVATSLIIEALKFFYLGIEKMNLENQDNKLMDIQTSDIKEID